MRVTGYMLLGCIIREEAVTLGSGGQGPTQTVRDRGRGERERDRERYRDHLFQIKRCVSEAES